MDAAALALLRPAQRGEVVLETAARRRPQAARRRAPGRVAVFYAETSDGIALVAARAADGPQPARAERLARSAAAALVEAAGLPAPLRAGDAELEAARWRGRSRYASRIRRPPTCSSCCR